MRRVRSLTSVVVLATAAALGVGAIPARADDPGLTSTSPPTVSGDPHVGEVLTAEPGTWDPDLDGTTFSYQWLRAGEPIDGEVAPEHEITGDDWCRDLSVVVTASAEGYADGTASSVPVHVSCLIADPIPTNCGLHVPQHVRADQRPLLRIRISTPGGRVTPVGRLVVRVKGPDKVERELRLRKSDEGRKAVRLPREHLGRHRVKVSFAADRGDVPLYDCDYTAVFKVTR